MKFLRKSALFATVSLMLAAGAHADQNAMQRAKELTARAHAILKENATVDKGGHRVAAMKHLKAALAEIDAGIAYDKANVTKNEGKKKSQVNR